jgi:hypothetical protein
MFFRHREPSRNIEITKTISKEPRKTQFDLCQKRPCGTKAREGLYCFHEFNWSEISVFYYRKYIRSLEYLPLSLGYYPLQVL